MNAPAKTDRITSTERRELRTVVRHQMKVLRAEVTQREAEMLAEAGVRLMDRYHEEDHKADALRREIAALTDEANAKLRKLVAKHENLFKGGKWDRVGSYSSPSIWRKHEDRDQLRRALAAGIRAQAKTARTKLERQEADLLRTLALDALETAAARAYLDELPTVTDLMSLPEIEAHVDAVGENALH